MEIKDLKYFCTAAELEHITKAAVSLNITQPYLTRVIHRIEDEVGGKLFELTGRRIRLTYTGEVFYKYACRVLAAMDNLYSEMDYLYNCRESTLTLLVNSDSLVVRLIKAFNRQHADYALSVQYATLEEMESALVSGQAQFALSSPPLQSRSSAENIETQTVLGLKGCIIVPPGHPLEGRSIVGIEEIRDERIVTMPKTNAIRHRLQIFFDDHAYQPHIVLETNNLNAIDDAVRSGIGLAFVTELMAMDFGFPRENIINVDTTEDMGFLGLSYNRLTAENRSCKHFLNFVQGFFADLDAVIERESPLRVPETEQSV